MPWSISASVIAPVPGPSSITGPEKRSSTYCAMVRARMRPDGITAPMCSGFSIHDRMKRTSSSSRAIFFGVRSGAGSDISLPGGKAAGRSAFRAPASSPGFWSMVTSVDRYPPFGIMLAAESCSCWSRGIGWHRYGQAALSGRAGAAAEEILDLGEEARRLRLGRARRQLLELGQQFLLLFGEVLRGFHHHLHIHIAGLARAQHRHALAADAESAAGLGSRWNLDAALALVDGWH